jgi:uncharacterized membrane protein (DUF2068 family)
VSHQKSALLSWIVAFKVLKSTLLTALGVVIFRYSHRDPVSVLWHFALAIHLPVTSRLFDRALRIATGLTVRRQIALGLTAFGYAALLGTEAIGLSLRRGWARWFTISITSSLLPFEVYEIWRDPAGPIRWLTFIANIAIVIYLYGRKEVFEP